MSYANELVAIESAFAQFDADGSGYIDSAELENLVLELDPDFDVTLLSEALSRLDIDGSGKVEKV